MAKASIVLTCRRCGKEFEHVHICKNRKEADQYEEWGKNNIDVCPDCYKIEIREHEEKARVEMEQEYDLPALTGTERQVAWARQIRHNFFLNDGARLREKYRQALREQTEARFWIDNKDDLSWDLKKVFSKIIKSEEQIEAEKEIAEEKEAEKVTVEPTTPSGKYVTIEVNNDVACLSSEKDKELLDVMHQCGWSWDKSRLIWKLSAGATTGTAEDAAAEAGNKLLNLGWRVTFPNVAIKDKALSGNFVPHCFRWVFAMNDSEKDFVYLKWEYGNENIYCEARRIKGSAWQSPYIKIPVKAIHEIYDFANAFGFRISAGAQRNLDLYAASVERADAEKVKAAELKDGSHVEPVSKDELLKELQDD